MIKLGLCFKIEMFIPEVPAQSEITCIRKYNSTFYIQDDIVVLVNAKSKVYKFVYYLRILAAFYVHQLLLTSGGSAR